MAFLDYIVPLKQIAEELRIIRELYEEELSTRPKELGGPIYRVTEKPSKQDTQVFMPDDEEIPKHKRWFGIDDSDEEEET